MPSMQKTTITHYSVEQSSQPPNHDWRTHMNHTSTFLNKVTETGRECDYGKVSDQFFTELANNSDKPKNARAVWALLQATECLEEMLHSRLLSGMAATGVSSKNFTNIIRLLMVLPKIEFASIKVAVLRQENVGGFVITLKQNVGVHALTQRTQRVLLAIGLHCAKLPVQYQPYIAYNSMSPNTGNAVRLYMPMHPVGWFSEKDILGRPHRANDFDFVQPMGAWNRRLDGQVSLRLAELNGCLDNVDDILNTITANGLNTFFTNAKPLASEEFIPAYLRTHLGVAGLKRFFETVRMNVLSPVRLYINLTFRLSIFYKENGYTDFVVNVFPSERMSASGPVSINTGMSVSTFEGEYEKFCQNYNLEPAASWLCFYHAATIRHSKQDEPFMNTNQTQVKPAITYNDECSLYRRFQGKLLTAIQTSDSITKAFNENFHGCKLNVDFVPATNTGGGIKRNHRTLCVIFTVSGCVSAHTTQPTLERTVGKLIDFLVGKMRIAGHKAKTKVKNNACVLAYFNLGEGYTCCEFAVGSNGISCDLKAASKRFDGGEDVVIQLSFYHREWTVYSDDGVVSEFEKAWYNRLSAGSSITRDDIVSFGLTKKEVRDLAGEISAGYEHVTSSDLNDLFHWTRYKTTDKENIYNGITISSHGSVLNGPAVVVGGVEQYTQYLSTKQPS
jgi:hypothetical protein